MSVNPDEVGLGNLMGDDGEKLLTLIDDIRKIDSLRDEKLHIPQIVVIGDTSTGKSSVLQALTRLPFPVEINLCTRFVTEVTIHRRGSSEKPGYTIEAIMDNTNTLQAAPFPPKSFESDDWGEVYQNLRADIDDAFDRMGPTKLPHPGISENRIHRSSQSSSRPIAIPKLLKHSLQITVRKPNQAHFSIVDIPGFVSSGATVDIHLSVELARQYVRNEEAIILAIQPADSVIANQKWLNLVTEERAVTRTIGVITKLDKMDETELESMFNLLRNRIDSEYHLKLGWFAVRNRSSQENQAGETLEDRDKKEKEFFRGGQWGEVTSNFPASHSINPEVLGIRYLKRTVQAYLYQRVKKNLPGLRKKLRKLEDTYTNNIQDMGDPRDEPRDQRNYLSEIQTKYEAEVARSLNGDYRFVEDPSHPSRLRYHVKTLNDNFNAQMFNAVKYKWQQGDTESGTTMGILTWIDKTWNIHRGSEPRHDPPPSLKKELVKQQTKSWDPITESYIDKVKEAIKACNEDLFGFACEDETLLLKIRSKLDAREKIAFKDAANELDKIMKDRNYIDSWNFQFEGYMTEFQRARIARQVELQLKLEQDITSATEARSPEAFINHGVSIHEKFYGNNKRVYEVHDWLYSYWKVAYPRFVDNVIIQVVERHLLGPNGPLGLFNRSWINNLKDEELEELGGENEETRAKRQDLKVRLDGLKSALEKVDIAMRLKT